MTFMIGTPISMLRSPSGQMFARPAPQSLCSHPELSDIGRALHRQPGPVQNVGIDLVRSDIGMAQEFLDSVTVKGDKPPYPIQVGQLCAVGVVPGADSSPDRLDDLRKAPLHLAGNGTVAKPLRLGGRASGRRLVGGPRNGGPCNRILREEDFVEDSQCVLGLAHLPVGDAFPLSQASQERLNVLSGPGFEAFLRDEFYEFLYPSKIVLGTIRRDPVFLRAPPIGSPKLVLAAGIAVFHGPHHKKALTSDSWMEKGNSY